MMIKRSRHTIVCYSHHHPYSSTIQQNCKRSASLVSYSSMHRVNLNDVRFIVLCARTELAPASAPRYKCRQPNSQCIKSYAFQRNLPMTSGHSSANKSLNQNNQIRVYAHALSCSSAAGNIISSCANRTNLSQRRREIRGRDHSAIIQRTLACVDQNSITLKPAI